MIRIKIIYDWMGAHEHLPEQVVRTGVERPVLASVGRTLNVGFSLSSRPTWYPWASLLKSGTMVASATHCVRSYVKQCAERRADRLSSPTFLKNCVS